MELTIRERKSVWKSFLDTFSNFENFEVIMPGDIVDRTELLCIYIEEETGKNFGLNEFVFLLYQDFLNYAVKNPIPSRILSEISRKNKKEEKSEFIKIVCNGVETYEKNICNNKKINRNKKALIQMDKRDAKKGKIILDEVYFSQGIYLSMEELISNLWTNFIVDYRKGVNKRAYKSIVKILKQVDLN